MKIYTIIPHRAGISLTVDASTTEELFESALMGMSNITKKDFCRKDALYPLAKTISITSLDQSSLLIDFLNRVLALSHDNKVVFCRLSDMSLDDKSLKAEIGGYRVDRFDEDIKAATHDGTGLRTTKRGMLEMTIFFDV
jgi:SHS2 domain-containing protein